MIKSDAQKVHLYVEVSDASEAMESILRELEQTLMAGGALSAKVIGGRLEPGGRGDVTSQVLAAFASAQVLAAVITLVGNRILARKEAKHRYRMKVEGRDAVVSWSSDSPRDLEAFADRVLKALPKTKNTSRRKRAKQKPL